MLLERNTSCQFRLSLSQSAKTFIDDCCWLNVQSKCQWKKGVDVCGQSQVLTQWPTDNWPTSSNTDPVTSG